MPNVYGLHALNSTERALAQAAQGQAEDILSRTDRPAYSTRPIPIYNASIGVPPTIVNQRVSTADGLYQSVPEAVWRTVEAGLGMASYDDPLAGLLLREWRTGAGPDIRFHRPGSRFTEEFRNSTTTLEHMIKLWQHWLNRRETPTNGPPFRISGTPASHRLTQGGMGFGVWQYALGNRAAQVMGSVVISEARYLPERDKVLWTGHNIMGTASWKAENIRRQIRNATKNSRVQINLPEPPNIRRPAPFGATIHVLQWYADVPSWVRARAI
jgi:hypothetical protein